MMAPRFDNLPEKQLYSNPPLRAYLTNVHRRHEYVRLLGLPSRKDRPEHPIDLMFVPPLVSPRSISVDSDPDDWTPQCESIYDALERHHRLLLLGDPGTGKTTLFHRLTWDLTFAPSSGPFVKRFGWMLPMPMLLRELSLGAVTTFDGLLEAFLSHPVGEPLREGDYLHSMLEQGRAFLMLDGIDELGSKEARLDFQSAVLDGMRRFPDCLWLLSSRIVGYGEVPYERKPKPAGQNGFAAPDPELPAIGKRYLAPFDDPRVRRFVFNWYRLRDSAAVKDGRAADLGDAIRRDRSLQRLARIPNVLALMVLVHRMEATLPHERSVLYRHIAEAYLESIDKHKGISESAGDLPRKKMWLGRVGFEMQCRRAHDGASDWLASCDDVLHWIGGEMKRSKAFVDVPAPAEFLSFVGRRSGLFVPIGDDQYAFTHLSFQEYFAALALEGEVTGFKWAKDGCSSLGFSRTDVAAWAHQPVWLETFCFLFEMLADRPEWHSELLHCAFGEDFALLHEADAGDDLFNLAHLLAHLAVNPYSGLSHIDRADAVDSCIAAQIRCSNYFINMFDSDSSLFEVLLRRDAHLSDRVMASIHDQWSETTESLEWKVLDCRRAERIDLAEIAKLSSANILLLSETDVGDVAPIAKMKDLQRLDLDYTLVKDVTPIGKLRSLEALNLVGTDVEDISGLANLRCLQFLWLSDTLVSQDSITELQAILPNCEIVKDR